MNKIFIITLFIFSNNLFSKNMKIQSLVSMDVNLRNIAFGNISYDLEFSYDTDSNIISKFNIKMILDKEKTSPFFTSKLRPRHKGFINKDQLSTSKGINSNQIIEDLNPSDIGYWFINKFLGEKLIELRPLYGNFSESKTFEVIFNSLRNSRGKLITKKIFYLEFISTNKEVNVFFKEKLNSEKQKIENLKINVHSTPFFSLYFSINANNREFKIF